MALRSVVSSKMPMVIILGATGTGKTKLSLELAQKFNTEIISADSMQIYRGLDIVTAKATVAERALVPHHLMDILEPYQCFTVVDFRNRALNIIDQLTQQGKVPIIVGGTNYYIESIVYNILVESMNDSSSLLWEVSKRKRNFDVNDIKDDISTSDSGKGTNKRKRENAGDSESVNVNKIEKSVPEDESCASKHKIVKDTTENNESNDKFAMHNELASNASTEINNVTDTELEIFKEQLKLDVDNEANFTNEEIHDKLKKIDPEMASRLHPNNRRKILRSIEVWLKSGRRHSELLDSQREREGKLRRPGATIVLWLKCDQQVLERRLDARVDSMLEAGLLEELTAFHAEHNRRRLMEGQSPDYTKGIFQTLGFKEFHEYLMLDETKRISPEGVKLLNVSIENMKIATKRYSRRQNKMTRARFLEHPEREVPPIFELDTTDLEKWNDEVENKAINIIESYLKGTTTIYKPLTPRIKEGKHLNSKSTNYCEVCQRIIIGDLCYDVHLNSFKHKKVLKIKARLAAKAAEEKSEDTLNQGNCDQIQV